MSNNKIQIKSDQFLQKIKQEEYSSSSITENYQEASVRDHFQSKSLVNQVKIQKWSKEGQLMQNQLRSLKNQQQTLSEYEISPPILHQQKQEDHHKMHQGYDGNGQGYDGNGQGYDGNGQGYDGNGQGYDGNGQGYDGNGQGYDSHRQGYDGKSKMEQMNDGQRMQQQSLVKSQYRGQQNSIQQFKRHLLQLNNKRKNKVMSIQAPKSQLKRCLQYLSNMNPNLKIQNIIIQLQQIMKYCLIQQKLKQQNKINNGQLHKFNKDKDNNIIKDKDNNMNNINKDKDNINIVRLNQISNANIQERLAQERKIAISFLNCGYGLKIMRENINDSSITPSKYNNTITTIMKVTLRKIQDYMRLAGAKIVPINSQQQKYLRAPLINCCKWLPKDELQTYYKFIKASYNLEQVNVSNHIVFKLYSSIMKQLRQRSMYGVRKQQIRNINLLRNTSEVDNRLQSIKSNFNEKISKFGTHNERKSIEVRRKRRMDSHSDIDNPYRLYDDRDVMKLQNYEMKDIEKSIMSNHQQNSL